MKLNVVIHRAEEGGYWAEILALPGCVSEGDTLDEMIFNIREAAEGWLEVAAECTLEAVRSSTDETTLMAIEL
jgi:predicted RNase H-like HicB family nuclease